MPNEIKVLVVVGDGFKQVEHMFMKEEGYSLTNDIEEADLVQFVGGADVNPALYNQHKHPTTYFDESRDEKEAAIYGMAWERGIPMAGICRGGQFLNVMNGGSMYQDVDGHGLHLTHDAFLSGSTTPIKVTSTHHQMMNPNHAEDHLVILTAKESTRREYMSYNSNTKPYSIMSRPLGAGATDIEALLYRKTRCLCFQPHPEYNGPYAAETRDLYFALLERFLFPSNNEVSDV